MANMAIQQFRAAVYQTIRRRAPALLDLLDALTVARHVESPVALSEEVPFRRQFSSVYDVLEKGEMDIPALAEVLREQQPAESETVAGLEVYALDATVNEWPAAETLPDRGQLKQQTDEAVRIGLKFSWLVRLVQRTTSWVAPCDLQRVPTSSSDSHTAAAQVIALDQSSLSLKVVVSDSLYGNHLFLAVFLLVKTVFALVRLRHNLTLYEQPAPKPTGSRGAPRRAHRYLLPASYSKLKLGLGSTT